MHERLAGGGESGSERRDRFATFQMVKVARSFRTSPAARLLADWRLARRLVASARVCGLCSCKRGGIRHRRGVSTLARQARDPVPNLSVKNVRVAVLRASD